MVVPFRTFAIFSLAFGMLAAGYLIGPAPGATQSPPSAPPSAPKAQAAVPLPKPAAPAVVANHPPVPLVRPQPTSYFTPAPTADSNPSDPAPAQTGALATDQPAAGDDAEARRAIEFDGYKNVHAIVKGSDGMWHARAMRGRAEIAVTVDATGNVSAE
ncbi:MAG: hypothetical protein ACM3II_06445 [Rhodospirillaceae bacterium]